MKKRIFTFLILLVAFFGLIGLTANNYKVINAAGDQASVDFDASVAINSVPDTAILSFPVTYESVYGNDIAWTVVANDYITYDETANWMVVKRSTTTDGTAKIIVTVSNGTYEKTEEKTVTIPKGFTSAPIYDIEYNLDGGAFEEGVQAPTSYKLGDASFNLPIPTKTSFVFKGWLDADKNEVKTILVGSMKSYSLTAQWEAKSIKEIKVTKDPTKTEYKGGETIDLTGIEVTAYYNDESTEPINAEQLIHSEYVNYGETKVELEYQGFTTSFNVTVEKNSWNITFKDKTVTYNGTEHSVTINEELPTAVNVSYENNTLTNVGNVEAQVSFSWNTEDENYSYYSTNYDLPTCNPVTLTIEKADLIVTTTAQTVKLSEIANIVWKFEVTGFCGEDSIEDVTITPEYYLEENKVTDFIAGKTYDVEFTGVAANYNVEIEGSTLTIATEEVTFEIQGEYKYNGEEQTLVVKAYDANKEEITGVLYDDKSSYSQVNAGTYKVTVTLADEKYGDISQEISFVIAKATATLSVKDTTSVYGEEVKLEYIATGFIESDLEKLNIQLTRNSESLNVAEYVVTLTYTDNANYDITKDLEGTHNITPKAATITMTPTTSIFGEEVNLAYTLEGFLGSDLEDVNNNIKLTGAKQGDSVGEYTVTAEYQNANYNVTINSAKHTITKRTATISVNTSSSTYGDEINLTYTTNNFYGNDLADFDINLSISSTDASETPYEIKVEYEKNPNYTINVVEGTHTIAPKPLINEDVNITVDEGDYNAQNENTLKPGVTIKYGEIEITTYEELEYAYADGYVGSATITITLTGNYSGTLTAQFEVTEYGKAGVDAALLPNTITEETTELPLTIGSSKVLWGTSNSAFSVDENGKVTVVHPTGDDVKVTLTAEVTYGTTSFYAREYQIVVSGLHRQQSNNVIVDNAEDVTLSVTVGENANYVVTPTEDNTYNTVAAYDITFTDESGEVSTFASPVTVRIPLPANYDANLTYAIWHKVGETYEPVEYTVKSGYFVFEATSFSPYIVTVAQNTVTFNANEGTGEMTTLTVNKGTTNTLSVNTFSRTGYTFSGWNTQIDGSGTSYTDKEAIKVTENITLYAQWKIKTHDITLEEVDENQGTVSVQLNGENVSSVAHGQTVVITVLPKDGYLIESIKINNDEKLIDEQLTYEIEVINDLTIEVTFVKDNNRVEITEWQLVTDSSTLAEGDKIIIAAKGYDFAVSTTQNNNNRGQAAITKSGNIITFGEDVQIITLENGTIEGTFAFNVGENNSNSYLYAAGANSGNYLRTRTAIDGNSSWKITISNDTTTIVAQGESSKNVMQYNQSSSLFSCYGSASQEALSIYKQITSLYDEEDVYTVTLDPNEGTIEGNANSVEIKYVSYSSVILPTPEKVGYTFLGWSDGTNTYTKLTANINLNLTAQWEINTYEISFDANGGTNSMESQTGQHGDAVTLNPNIFEKTGFTFNGWQDQKGNLYADEAVIESLTENLVLKAQWISDSSGSGNESEGGATETTENISIAGTTGVTGTDTISWISGDVTFTNNKANSTSNIRTSDSDHFRAYAHSEVVVSCAEGTITKIVITCTGSSYATAMQESATKAEYTATVSDSTVTITLDGSSNLFKIEDLTAQVRIKSVSVTYIK